MGRPVRDDDDRSDELLEEHGRVAAELALAVAWTSGIRGAKAKVAAEGGTGAWKRAAPFPDPDYAAGVFRTRCRTRNPVCAAQASGLVLVEVDGEDDLPARLGLELPETATARSRRGLHRYYRPPIGRQTAKFQIDESGVMHAEDGYVCIPPSIHPSGVIYTWVTNGRVAELPEHAYVVLITEAGQAEIRVAELVEAGEKVPEGRRRNFIFARALTMAHEGLSEAEILPSMLVLGSERCEPALSAHDVTAQVRGAVKRARVKPSVHRREVLELERELAAEITRPMATPTSPRPEQPGVVSSKAKLAIVTADAIEARRQGWLVHGLVPLRTMTLVAGVGGLGKSTWSIQLAAKVTRGELEAAGDVVIVSFEDAAEEVIRPRLEAAGAVLDKVGIVVKSGGILTLPTDFPELTDLLRARSARLLIVDPVSAAMSLKLDAHRDQDVRVVLGELDRIVRELDMAALLVAHLNKAPTTDPYLRIGGSAAFYNSARSVVTITLDPDDADHRLVAQHKANYSRLVPVQRHRIEEHSYWAKSDFIVTSRMVFVEDAEGVDPYGVLASTEVKTPTKKDTAATLLVAMLADGDWHEREGLERIADARGISRSTLDRAASAIGVETDLRGFPARSWWRLPAASTPIPNELTQQAETA